MKKLLRLQSFAVALLLLQTGCETNLTTSVEVYNPPARLAELKAARMGSQENEIERQMNALLKTRKQDHIQLPGDWFDAVAMRVTAHSAYLQSFVDGLTKATPAKDVATAAFVDTTKAIVAGGNQVITDTTNKLQSTRDLFFSGKASAFDTLVQVDVILKDFVTKFKTAMIGKGDPENLPKPLRDTVANVDLPTLLQQVYGMPKMNWSHFANEAPSELAQIPPQNGVFQPDKITETYTDTLLNLALKDPTGWNVVPAATKTFADGKSEVVIVRDGEFSFSVHSMKNDPSGVLKARVGAANSALQIFSKAVTMYAGLPAIPAAATPTDSTSGNQTPAVQPTTAPVDPASLQIADLSKLLKERHASVTNLLNQIPGPTTSVADAQKWLDYANALLSPTHIMLGTNTTPAQ